MPVSSVCNVIEAVLEHLGSVTVDCLSDLVQLVTFAYEFVGEILYMIMIM